MSVTRVLGVVVVVLIIFYLFWFCFLGSTNVPTPSFDYFLQIIRDCPVISTDWIKSISTITVDWGIFNFLRDFINVIINGVQGFLFMLTAVTQIVWYVIWFFGTFALRLSGF